MKSELDVARYTATQEVAAAICKAAGEVMKTHGNDPQGSVIVAAGFVMALRGIGDECDARIPAIVHEMLKPKVAP